MTDAQAAIDKLGDDIGESLGILVIRKRELKLRITPLRTYVEIDDRLDQIAGERRGQPASVGAEDVASHAVMHLSGGARTRTARQIGRQGLAENGLAHLTVDVLAEALVQIRAAGLACFGEFDDHRFGNYRRGVASDIRHRAEQGSLV